MNKITPMSAALRLTPELFLKLSADISSSYGFRPVRDIERSLPPALRPKGAQCFDRVAHLCSAAPKVKIGPVVAPTPGTPAIPLPLRRPVLAYYATPSPSHLPVGLSSHEIGEFGLFVGSLDETMGEILIIKTIAAILSECGLPATRIRLNAMGDRESQQRFVRELSLYLRKHASELVSDQEHPFLMHRRLMQLDPERALEAPRAVNFLSEKSRGHFRTLLEQLETLKLPYELDHNLLGDEREQRVVFAIDTENAEHPAVRGSVGGRYDDFVQRLTGRKDGGSVHASIFFHRKGLPRSTFTTTQSQPSAKVYFVQLGTRAKLQSLAVLDVLRAAKIPTLQSFDSAHLSDQLAAAKEAAVPYVLIMGQREVLDSTIIVRSTSKNTQTTLPLSQLPRYLKTLRV